jgi:hypothetical protein
MPRKLRIWNGRGDYRKFPGHFYVCATTKKRAVELVTQAGRAFFSMRELNEYWSELWGNPMKGVTPEEGVWYVNPEEHLSSKKVIPRRLI